MEKIRVIIDKEGNYTLDLIEGFSGMSCEQKADAIVSICGGIETKREEKPEYYDSEDVLNNLYNI